MLGTTLKTKLEEVSSGAGCKGLADTVHFHTCHDGIGSIIFLPAGYLVAMWGSSVDASTSDEPAIGLRWGYFGNVASEAQLVKESLEMAVASSTDLATTYQPWLTEIKATVIPSLAAVVDAA